MWLGVIIASIFGPIATLIVLMLVGTKVLKQLQLNNNTNNYLVVINPAPQQASHPCGAYSTLSYVPQFDVSEIRELSHLKAKRLDRG